MFAIIAASLLVLVGATLLGITLAFGVGTLLANARESQSRAADRPNLRAVSRKARQIADACERACAADYANSNKYPATLADWNRRQIMLCQCVARANGWTFGEVMPTLAVTFARTYPLGWRLGK